MLMCSACAPTPVAAHVRICTAALILPACGYHSIRNMISYLGTSARFHDVTISNRVLLNTYGASLAIVDVPDQSSGIRYSRDHEGIKSLILSINEAHQQRRISLKTKCRRLRNEWIPLTEEFVTTWGLHMVSYDIRQGIADVRRHLKLDAIVWPAILCVEENGGGVIVPDHVDAFGLALADGNNVS